MNTRFKFFNPNPSFKPSKTGKIKRWTHGDCVVRSICAATGLSWETAYKQAVASSLKIFDMPSSKLGSAEALKDLGFKKMSYPRGYRRETVNEFAANHRDEIAILQVSGHMVCCRDGFYWDVWDCGNCTAYCYYVLEK